MSKYIVYRTENIINNRFYIGVHAQHSEEFDGYFGSGKLIKNAIKKHGRSAFIRKTLFEYDNPSDAFRKEMELMVTIHEDSCSYNIAEGGYGWTGIGSFVRDSGIGIHSLSFEERSNIQKHRIANTAPDRLFELYSNNGKIGGRKCFDNGLGIFALDEQQRRTNAKLGAEKLKELGIGFSNSETQRQLGMRGGVKNKGFKWYTDGISQFKYTMKEQTDLPFVDFLEKNPSFKAGRITLEKKNES